MAMPWTAGRKLTTQDRFAQIVVSCGHDEALGGLRTSSFERLRTHHHHAALPRAADRLSILELRGNHWFVQFEGSKEFSVPANTGMRYITLLLSKPFAAISALHLVQLGRCCEPSSGVRNAQELLDVQALSQLEQRLVDAKDAHSIAVHNNDLGEAEKLRVEVEQLKEELRSSAGLGGSSRSFTDEHERARKSVTNAINRSKAKCYSANKFFGIHLGQINTGYEIRYEPAIEIKWEIVT